MLLGSAPLTAQLTNPVTPAISQGMATATAPLANAPFVQPYSYGLSPSYQNGGWNYSTTLFHTSFSPRMFSGFRGNPSVLAQGRTVDLGPFGLTLTRVRSEMIASDNVNATPDKESGWIARTSLGAELSWRFSDNFFFRVSGELVWLPLVNKVGINGFGLEDALTDRAGLAGSIGLGNNLAIGWNGVINDWDVTVFNTLQNEWLSAYWRGDATPRLELSVWDPLTFEAIDRAGRYSFGTNRAANSWDTDGTLVTSEESYGLGDRNRVLRNTTGVTAGKDLETVEARFDLSVSHTYEWKRAEGATETTETRWQGVTATGYSMRENARFRPFVVGKVFRQDNDGWWQSGTVGVISPLTDQMSLIADVGHVRTPTDRDTETWRVALRHVAGPYTVHSATYQRRVEDDLRVRTSYDYRLSQMLGSRLAGTFLYSRGRGESLIAPFRETEDETMMVQLAWDFNPSLQLITTWLHTRQWSTDLASAGTASERYQFRVELIQDLKNYGRLTARFIHDDYNSTNLSPGYVENVFYLTLDKDL